MYKRQALLSEAACPYVPNRDDNNITYSPLAACGGTGEIRAGQIRPVTTYDQLLTEIRNNRPVVVGFTLSRSYMTNRGLVRHHDKVNKSAATGRDAGGHANLLVGYVKLPPSLAQEGRYCVITANSWDLGWGRGGHACLTETWLQTHLGMAVSVASVEMTDNGLSLYDLN